MATRKQNRRTALLMSFLRFNPELGALSQLFADARGQRDLSIQNAKGGAASMIETLNQQRPDVEGIYSKAGADRAAGFGEANAAVAGLPGGGVVDAIRAGMARESAGATSRAADAGTRDLTDLSKRKVSASQGAIYDQREARNRYGDAAAKLNARLLGIKAEQGAYVESQAGILSKEDRAAATAEFAAETSRMSADTSAASAEESARANRADESAADRTAAETERANRAREKAGGKKGGARNRRTADQRAGTKSIIRSLAGLVPPQYREPGHGKSALKSIKRRASKDPLLAREKVAKDPLILQAAAEYALYGKVDANTRRQLLASYGIGGV